MIRPWTTGASILFGAIGFGLGLVVGMGAPGSGAPGTWIGALAMTGFGAGTGAGVGRSAGWPFKLGIWGAVVGAMIGVGLDLGGAGYPVAGVAAVAVVVSLVLVDGRAPDSVR